MSGHSISANRRPCTPKCNAEKPSAAAAWAASARGQLRRVEPEAMREAENDSRQRAGTYQ